MNLLLLMANAILVGLGSSMVLSQNAEVPAIVSVGHRMVLAGIILLVTAGCSGKALRIRTGHILWVVVQGSLMFGLAYVSFYSAVRYIPSGLVALALSLSPMLTALISSRLTQHKSSRMDKLGMACGVLGILIVFLGGLGPELTAPSHRHELLIGLVWALISALATAAGTSVGARNQMNGISGVAVIGWGLVSGGVASIGVALLLRLPIVDRYSFSYLSGLGYLVVGGSVIAFLLYFELIRRAGPARASFSFVLVPVIAIAMSMLREGVVLTLPLALGASIALFGNIVVSLQKAAQKGQDRSA